MNIISSRLPWAGRIPKTVAIALYLVIAMYFLSQITSLCSIQWPATEAATRERVVLPSMAPVAALEMEPVADPKAVVRAWEAAVEAMAPAELERSVVNMCTEERVACNLREVGPAGYVLYLADIMTNSTTTGGDGIFYDYALPAIRRLSQVIHHAAQKLKMLIRAHPLILREDLVGSHARWKRPCLQTAHMTI
jgi:hypothetical protein